MVYATPGQASQAASVCQCARAYWHVVCRTDRLGTYGVWYVKYASFFPSSLPLPL